MDILNKIKKLFKDDNGKINWYYGLIYLLIITIPFNHKEAFSILNPDLVWSKYILIALAVAGLYFYLKNYKNYIRDPFFVLLFSFVVFQLLSLIQTRDLESSFKLIAFQSALTFAYIPVRDYINARKNGLRDLIFMYVLVFVPVLIFLGIQIYLQTNYGKAIGGVWPVPGYPTRYGSTFWDINHFGAFCSALILILIGYCSTKSINKYNKLFAGVVAFGALIALHLTSSRSALIGFLTGLAVLFVIYVRRFKYKRLRQFQYGIFYLSIISFVGGLLWFLYKFEDAIKASLLYRSVSFFSHLFLLRVGIIIGIQNFLLGIGANSFHAYFKQTQWADAYYYIDRAAMNLKLPLHNLWLEVLAETGLVSFIVFLTFWIILLVGLYKSYKNTSDNVILGFIAATTSFLVAGFMYSYKSEFFWMFILIACAYVSKIFFNKTKVNVLTSIKELVSSDRYSFERILVIALSVFVLLIPFIFITHPLGASEIKMFYGGYKPNLATNNYSWLLAHFRYIIGNYTYTGRVLSVIFYLGSIGLLFIMLRRYIGNFYALVVTSILFGAVNIFEPVLIVSIKSYISFAVLALAGFAIFLISFLNRDPYRFNIFKKVSPVILGAVILLIGAVGLVSNNMYFNKNLPEDLTFLLELAYNRRMMDGSVVQVSKTIDQDNISYYVDEIRKDKEGLYTLEGTLTGVTGISIVNFPKNLYIYTDEDDAKVEQYIDIAKIYSVDVTKLKQGKYNLVYIEKNPEPGEQPAPELNPTETPDPTQ